MGLLLGARAPHFRGPGVNASVLQVTIVTSEPAGAEGEQESGLEGERGRDRGRKRRKREGSRGRERVGESKGGTERGRRKAKRGRETDREGEQESETARVRRACLASLGLLGLWCARTCFTEHLLCASTPVPWGEN